MGFVGETIGCDKIGRPRVSFRRFLKRHKDSDIKFAYVVDSLVF